jgi:hypothetical protein
VAGGPGGRPHPIVWDGKWNDEKKNYIVAVGGLQSMILFNATTNQKQAAAMDGTTEGMCDKREARGKHDTIVL